LEHIGAIPAIADPLEAGVKNTETDTKLWSK
jgi:hypothetical protein